MDSTSWVLSVAHEKSKAPLPLLCEQPGPHGHPDVTLPICDQHPEKRMHWWQDTRKSALFTMWGTAKATDTPVVIRETQMARKREESQVRRAAAPLSRGAGARRRGGVPVRGFCGVVDRGIEKALSVVIREGFLDTYFATYLWSSSPHFDTLR